ncbi:MAG: oligosaccharyl transferase, archaeosortase A system-associated [Archaeoglobaceae archaeon]|nr:oligosaccharyl transferase, archaeosortase A system-associated [Archaeoglobaceae archaeon]MCX8152722.1 oligosaccharyl transferase, archaeosortase A system-associated [Archaeoglobaceae archaeon]MDW8013429.1 oligosaccharyl transferase, archaeosortase A system-associated [Archaeoglobaceae archaeon]
MRYSKLVSAIVLILTVILAIKIRILNPWNSVFTFSVLLSENDPWYYYRLIENCIKNFPNRIWFDPMTQYPYGTYTHFGPFLVYLSTILALITNSTSGEALRNVLVFIPAFGGILVIFAMFFFARRFFDLKTALIASILIAIIPGQFLHRSTLSFNDHHVWEVLWMLLTLAFFALIFDKKFDRNGITLAIIGGLCFSLYILTWAAGFTFGLLFVSAIYLSLLLRIKISAETFKLLVVFFASSALFYLPFAFRAPSSPALYSPMQLNMLIFYTISTVFLWKFDEKIKFYKEALLIILALAGVFAASLIFPEFYTTIGTVTGYLQPRGGALTIGEVKPFFSGNGFTLFPAFYHFGTTFFFAVPLYFYLIYRLIKFRNAKDLIILLWGIALLVALIGQNRFAYYFAAVSSVYCAAVLNLLFEKLDLYKLIEKRGKKKVNYFGVALAIILAFIVFYPTYSLAESQTRAAGVINQQWFEAMVWLRENTPGKENYEDFYYKLYEQSNPTEPYKYPFETYGVLSWWDYGHWILSIGKRMAIANPFQQGIGSFQDSPGAAPFFISQDESYSEKIAEKLKVRYVVSDIEMATGKFYAMATWAEGDLPLAAKYYDGFMYYGQRGFGFVMDPYLVPPNSFMIPLIIPSDLYYKTMEAKLHIYDASGLSHYRLVYESKPAWDAVYYEKKNESEIVQQALVISYQLAIQRLPVYLPATQEVLYKLACRIKGLCDVEIQPSGYVKIFERVKGAIVTGKAESDFVEVSLKIKTNQDRIFTYKKIVKVENGKYELILPYAQETVYPVKPIENYKLRAGDVVKEIRLSDDDVLNGKKFNIDLI